MEFKSILVHFPIDVTKTELYRNVADHTSHGSADLFDPEGYDLKVNNKFASDTVFAEAEMTGRMFCDKGRSYEKRISVTITQTFYEQKNRSDDVLSVHCWHCSRLIKWRPCGLPVSVNNNGYVVKGFYCTLNCALAANYYSNERENVIQEREGLIRQMYRKSYPNEKNELAYAPPKEALRYYGGPMSYEEFHLHNKFVNFVYVPQIPLSCQIEENVPVPDFSFNLCMPTNA